MERPPWARIAQWTVAGVLAAWTQAQIWSSAATYDVGGRPLNAALAAGFALPLFVLHRWPLPVLVVVLAAVSADNVLGSELGQAWVALLVVLLGVGRYAAPGAAVAGLGLTGGAVLAVDLPRLRDGAPLDEVLPGWLVLVGIWALGRWLGRRREDVAVLEERARAAASHERARMARELHDLVAHSMAVTTVQAQAGRRVLDSDPEAARRALEAIEHLSRDGLTELRRLLGLLAGHEGVEELDPPASLSRLDDLVARLTATGLPVALTVSGQRDGIPAGVDLSAYRIVQEALTNALKHAGPGARVELDVTYRPDAVEIVVTDDGGAPTDSSGASGPPGSTAGSGRGLVGMRERAALFGGSVDAGRRSGGGFEVRARLPWGSP